MTARTRRCATTTLLRIPTVSCPESSDACPARSFACGSQKSVASSPFRHRRAMEEDSLAPSSDRPAARQMPRHQSRLLRTQRARCVRDDRQPRNRLPDFLPEPGEVLCCRPGRRTARMTWAGTLGSAAAALAALAGLDQFACDARQAAVARYSRIGFEAAAATGMGLYGSGIPRTRPGVVRTAELRFGQPYAVVAVIADQDHHARQYPLYSPRGGACWSSLPGSPSPRTPCPARRKPAGGTRVPEPTG